MNTSIHAALAAAGALALAGCAGLHADPHRLALDAEAGYARITLVSAALVTRGDLPAAKTKAADAMSYAALLSARALRPSDGADSADSADLASARKAADSAHARLQALP